MGWFPFFLHNSFSIFMIQPTRMSTESLSSAIFSTYKEETLKSRTRSQYVRFHFSISVPSPQFVSLRSPLWPSATAELSSGAPPLFWPAGQDQTCPTMSAFRVLCWWFGQRPQISEANPFLHRQSIWQTEKSSELTSVRILHDAK